MEATGLRTLMGWGEWTAGIYQALQSCCSVDERPTSWICRREPGTKRRQDNRDGVTEDL
jgi:hypothetical protein